MSTSVHNDASDADDTDDANATENYNRVIGIAQLKAFSCAKNQQTATFTNHSIAIYVPTMHMPLICHISKSVRVQLRENNVSKCASLTYCNQ